MRFGELLAELKKRNVYRATVAYIVAAGFAIQVLTASTPYVGIPEFWVKVTIWGLFIAFPFVVAFSWAFDITLRGVKRAGETEPGEAVTRRMGNAFPYVIAGIAAAGLVIFFWQLFRDRSKSTTVVRTTTSIAVIPFQNLSRNPDDAYLVDAVHDAVTKRLSRSAQVRMVSRESTSVYRTPDSDPLLTAKQLGATIVIEGGAEKADDDVRIDVRLIKTKERSKPVSFSFRGSVDNFSSLEVQIAKAIAETVNLDAKELGGLLNEDKLTTNPEALRSYLRGIALARPATMTDIDRSEAVKAFRKAVALDAYFVEAWAELARCCAELYDEDYENLAAPAEEAQRAAKKALQLQPEGARTLLAQGYVQWLVLKDYGNAKESFEGALKQLPGSAEIPQALALTARHAGSWKECLALFEQIMRNDPGNLFILKKWGYTNEAMRRFAQATELFDRGLRMAPEDRNLLLSKIEICHATGDLSGAARLLATLPADDLGDASIVNLRFEQFWLQRRFGDAAKLMDAVMKTLSAKADFGLWYNQCEFQLGMAEQAQGKASAPVHFLVVLDGLKDLQPAHPKDVRYPRLLSQVYAKLEKKNEAIQEAEKAVRLSPTSVDAYDGPIEEVNRALVETWTGDFDRAVVELERLVTVPINSSPPLTPTLLRIDTRWDPLRENKRFQRISDSQ